MLIIIILKLLFRLGVMWRVSKGDITATLSGVCDKLLRDHSVSSSVITRRSEALLLLGQEFSSRGVPFEKGFVEFITNMEARSGLFDDTKEKSTPLSDSVETQPADDDL